MKLLLRLKHAFTEHDWSLLGTKGVIAHWECSTCGARLKLFSGVSPFTKDAIERSEKRKRNRQWP